MDRTINPAKSRQDYLDAFTKLVERQKLQTNPDVVPSQNERRNISEYWNQIVIMGQCNSDWKGFLQRSLDTTLRNAMCANRLHFNFYRAVLEDVESMTEVVPGMPMASDESCLMSVSA